MKKVMVVVMTMAMMTTWVQALSSDRVTYFEDGDKGYFEYPSDAEGDGTLTFTIWPQKTLSGVGRFCGLITPTTKITVANRRISRSNLDLLTGKLVIAYGRFKEVGRGEGSRKFCLELTIFLLPEDSYRGSSYHLKSHSKK